MAAIEKSRGRVWYHWQKTGGALPNPAEQPSWPKSLVDRLGVDYFGHITQVVAPRGGTSDSLLARIGQLRRLQDLAIDGKFTDAGLAHLQSLHELRILVLISPNVTDAGLAHLEGLTNLEALELFCHVGDAGLAHLKNLTRLETLSLAETTITDAGLVHLKRLTKLSRLSLSGTRDDRPRPCASEALDQPSDAGTRRHNGYRRRASPSEGPDQTFRAQPRAHSGYRCGCEIAARSRAEPEDQTSIERSPSRSL